jgi:hypothetical protein
MFIAFSDIVCLKRIGAHRARHLPCITPLLFRLFLIYLAPPQASPGGTDPDRRDTGKDPNGNSKQEMLHANAVGADKSECF